MKNQRQAKCAAILNLHYHGLRPGIKVLQDRIPYAQARAAEQQHIAQNQSDFLCCCTKGGEGLTRNALHAVYALFDPRNGQIFYVGISVHPEQRLQEHVDEALGITLTVIKIPDLGKVLASVLNLLGDILAVAHAVEPLPFIRKTKEEVTAAWPSYAGHEFQLTCGLWMHTRHQALSFLQCAAQAWCSIQQAKKSGALLSTGGGTLRVSKK